MLEKEEEDIRQGRELREQHAEQQEAKNNGTEGNNRGRGR